MTDDWRSDRPEPETNERDEHGEPGGIHQEWRSDNPVPEPEELGSEAEAAELAWKADAPQAEAGSQNPTHEEPKVVAHFEPESQGLGLDGDTPLEAGIQGRLTHAGAHRPGGGTDRDWERYVEVDQPVQKVEAED